MTATQRGVGRPVEPGGRPSPVYAAMSVDNLSDAIETMLAVRHLFRLQTFFAHNYEHGRPLHEWSQPQMEAVEIEISRMIAEMERRDLAPDSDDYDIRRFAIAKAWHVLPGGRYRIHIERTDPAAAAAQVDAEAAANRAASGRLVEARDKLADGVSLLHTTWLALAGNAVDGGFERDFEAVTDAIWQSLTKLEEAKERLG